MIIPFRILTLPIKDATSQIRSEYAFIQSIHTRTRCRCVPEPQQKIDPWPRDTVASPRT